MKMLNLIQSLAKFGMNSDGCQRMKVLCDKLGNPQEKLKFIHIGGTNGKGSTCHMVASVLEEQKLKVGVYISPALYKFNERITISSLPISDNQLEGYYTTFTKLLKEFDDHPLGTPTEFEVVTALAFQYFFDEKVDYVVLEVGLGGRFDATNVVIPEASIITNIDLDHTEILGNTIEEIAFEKAGIIKPNVPILLGIMDEKGEKVIKFEASKKHAPVMLARDVNIEESTIAGLKQKFVYKGKEYKLGLLGKHQLDNVKLVFMLFELLKEKVGISDKAMVEGLKKANWPGRFEVVSNSTNNKTLVFDVAHNPQSMEMLMENLETYFKNKRITLVLGVFKDKDTGKILESMVNRNHSLVITKPIGERGMDSQLLAQKAKDMRLEVTHENQNIEAALEYALQANNDIICISGSFNTVGPARNYLLTDNK